MNREVIRHGCAVLVALCALGVWAQQADARGKFRRQGSTSARLGFGAFAVRNINSDGSDAGSTLGLSLLGGLSYAIHPRMLVDGDLELFYALNPQLDLIQVEMTPGARVFITPSFYARGAYAVRLLDPGNELALLGAGYYISQSSLAVFVELNYVLWSEREVDPPLVPRFGAELRF